MVFKLQQQGFSLEEIAELLELDVATVRVSKVRLKHYSCSNYPI